MKELLENLEKVGHQVDLLVLETPTGEQRNLLTEANIHLLTAQVLLSSVYASRG